MKMNKVFKAITYITVSFILSFIVYNSGNTFFCTFNTYIIPLLATLLAINLTAVALFLSELKKLKEKLPKLNEESLIKEISTTMKKQICIIMVLIIVLMVKDVNFLISDTWRTILANAFSLCTLVYFLEVIYDTFGALLDIIHENS